MIFCSKNEDGIPKWKMILEGRKVNGHIVDLTRRIKPQPIGAIRAVQPNRGIKQVCKIEILSCKENSQWMMYDARPTIDQMKSSPSIYFPVNYQDYFEIEANREGFKHWSTILNFLRLKKIDINDTYRIEFKLLKNSCKSELEEM